MKNDAGKLQCKISRFLLAYRNAPHSLTGESPGCLFMNRMLRTNIDCIQPRNDNIIAQKMENIRLKRGGRKRECLKVGQKVAVLNYSKYGGKWIRGTIKVIEGPLTYLVETGNDRDLRRHVDQIITLPPLSYEKHTSDPNADDFMLAADFTTRAPITEPEIVTVPDRRYPVRDRAVPTRYGHALTH